MDSIVTLKKGQGLELNRRIMNDCMDLIYQVGHKKIKVKLAKTKMHELLRVYFFHDTERLNSVNLKRFEHFFDSLVFMTYSIMDMIDIEKEPLYKTIVKMNQLLVSTKKLKQNFIQRHGLVIKKKKVHKTKVVTPGLLTFKKKTPNKKGENMQTKDVQKSHESINELINEVLEQKKRLKQSVISLNQSLAEVGFELRELDSVTD